MSGRRSSKAELPPRTTEVELPDGRRLEEGDEFSLFGGGRYRFAYEYRDGSLTAYGPVGSNRAQWRSFRPDAVKTVHRKRSEVRS